MADGRVEIDVIMDDGSVRKGVANLSGMFNDLGAKADGAGSKIKGIATAVGAVALVAKGIEVLKNSVGSAVSRFDTLNNSTKTFQNMGFSAAQTKSMMDDLGDSIQGLPTSLDEAVSGVQLLAGATSDIGKSQKIFSAMNDGIIGFGGNSENVSESVRQLSQALAGGKVDAETWNSMLDNGMGPALNAIAKKLGMTSAALKDGLSTGKVSVAQFEDALVDLDKNGGGGLSSLRKIALDSTDGIKTGFANMNTAIVRGMTDVLTAVNAFMKAVTGGGIGSAFAMIGSAAESSLGTIAKFITSLANNAAVISMIKSAFEGIGNAISFVIGTIASLLGLIQSIYGFLKPLLPLILGIATAIFAYQGIVAVIAAVSSAVIEVGAAFSAISVIASGLAANGFLLSEAFTAVKGAMAGLSTFGLIGAVIAGLVVAFIALYKSSETFRNAVNNLASGAMKLLGTSVTWLKGIISSLEPTFSAIGNTIRTVFGSAIQWISGVIENLSPIMNSIGSAISTMGGAFGSIGTILGVAAGMVTKFGLVLLGITGPIGLGISLISSFLVAWAKTGQLNASGITQVFTNLSNTISNVSNTISANLPQIISTGTQIIVELINSITSAIPQLTSAAVGIINGLTQGLTTALPLLIQGGVQILTGIVNAIVSALPTLVSAATQIITTLLNGIIAILPMLLMAGIQILTALMNGIITMLPMLITAGLQILMALVNAIITNLPQILQAVIQIMMALMNGIVTMLPMLLQSAIQIIMALVNGLIANLPQIITAAVQLIVALVTGIISVLPQLVMAALQLMVALLGAIIQAAPQLLAAGVQLILALVSGVLSIIGALIGAAVQLGSALIGAIINFVGQMLSAGVQLVGQVVSGIASGIGKAASTAKSVASGAVSAVSGFASHMLSAGKNFVSGFVNGIKSMAGEALSAAKDMASKAVNAAKSLLHIHSPSRVMYAIGAYTGEGFTNGIKSYVDQAGKASKQLANAAIIKPSEMSYSGNLLSGLFNGSITAESALGINGKLAPTSSVVNNYNSTTNNGDGSSDKALDYLKQIANKNTVVDGSSFANRLSSFSSSVNANRQSMAGRGLSIDSHI